MPSKGKAVGNLVKWGVKYGPHVVVLAQQAKEPAMKAAQTALDRQKARRRAIEHAATVRDGHGAQDVRPAGRPQRTRVGGLLRRRPRRRAPHHHHSHRRADRPQRPLHPGPSRRPARRPPTGSGSCRRKPGAPDDPPGAGHRTRPGASLPHALRSRVAGDGRPDQGRAHLGRARAPRWFTPDDPIWRVHADAAMFPGGHPRAPAPVAAPARDGRGGRALAATRATRGDGCSAPASSSRPRRSAPSTHAEEQIARVALDPRPGARQGPRRPRLLRRATRTC